MRKLKERFSEFKGIIIGLVLGTAFVAYAAPHIIRSDSILFGRSLSTADKKFEFDTGDAPLNVELFVDDSRNGSFTTNNFTLGDSLSSNKTILADIGGSNPFLQYDVTLGKWLFSNDGSSTKAIGSGGGGGGGINLLQDVNPDFEGGITSWTNTGGGSFVALSATADVDNGDGSARWDASAASDTLESSLGRAVQGLKSEDCLGAFRYKWPSGSAGDIKVIIEDQTNAVLRELEDELLPSDEWSEFIFGFVCPDTASDQVSIKLEATADAAAIDLDDVFAGSNKFEFQTNAAEYVGAVEFEPPNCSWTWNSSSYANAANAGSCTTNTVGKLSTVGAVRPAANLADGAPGAYTVSFTFLTQLDGDTHSCRIKDDLGNTLAEWGNDNIAAAEDDNNQISLYMEGTVIRTDQGAKEFEVQCKIASGSIGSVANKLEVFDAKMEVHFKPSQASRGIRVSDTPFVIYGKIVSATNGFNFPTGSSSTLTEMTASDGILEPGSGSYPVQIACATGTSPEGDTCNIAAVNESLGFSWVMPKTSIYRACISYGGGTELNAGQRVQIHAKFIRTADSASTFTTTDKNFAGWDTDGSSMSGSQTQNFRRYKHHLCSTYLGVGGERQTLRVMQTHDNSKAMSITSNRTAGAAEPDITFWVAPVSSGVVDLFIKNQLSSVAVEGRKVCSIRVTNSGTPTVESDDGCLDSGTPLDDNGDGVTNLNFTVGVWSQPPVCTCTGTEDPGAFPICTGTSSGLPTVTDWEIQTVNSSGVAGDTDFMVRCSSE